MLFACKPKTEPEATPSGEPTELSKDPSAGPEASEDPSSEPTTDPSYESTTDPSEESTTDPSEEATTDPSYESTTDPSEDISEDPSEEIAQMKVKVETLDAEQITMTTAFLNGRVTIENLPSGADIDYYFYISSKYRTAQEIYDDGYDIALYKSFTGWADGVEMQMDVDDLDYDTKYYYILLLWVDDTYYLGNVKSFKTASCGDYAHAVDLGLSVKWCDVNIGAETPQEDGFYFAWGEIKEKYRFTENNYAMYDSSGKLTNYKGEGSGDSKKKLSVSDDAAYKLLGRSWRMPTRDECQELIDNCNWEFISNGFYWKVTGKNGNYIYIPNASFYDENGFSSKHNGKYGSYWTSTLNWEDPDLAYSMDLNSTWSKPNYTQYIDGNGYRFYGLPIRAVARE